MIVLVPWCVTAVELNCKIQLFINVCLFLMHFSTVSNDYGHSIQVSFVGCRHYISFNSLTRPSERRTRKRCGFIGFLLFSVYLSNQTKAKMMSSNVAFKFGLLPFARKAKKHRFHFRVHFRLVWFDHYSPVLFLSRFILLNIFYDVSHTNYNQI